MKCYNVLCINNDRKHPLGCHVVVVESELSECECRLAFNRLNRSSKIGIESKGNIYSQWREEKSLR